MSVQTEESDCPYGDGGDERAAVLPVDGTPTRPSPRLAWWREQAPATPLRYADGAEGLLVTRYDDVKAVLADRRFSQLPQRMPAAEVPAEPVPAAPLDDLGREASRVANLLGMDGDAHTRLRRTLTSRFSVRSARSLRPAIAAIVGEELGRMIDQGPGVDLTEHFARPVSARGHRLVLGIPDELSDGFVEAFVRPSGAQQKFDHIREALGYRSEHPGEDVFSDLLSSDLSRAEIEGLALVLCSSGRDSIAYVIATSVVGLLSDRRQWTTLHENPELVPPAIEELLRYGSMFITLFPRTATEDLQVGGIEVRAGQTVSASAVAGNRDPRRFPEPDRLDVRRDGFGHLAFGFGRHGCLGQQFARIELDEALGQLTRTLPQLELVQAEQLQPMPFANPVATYEAGAVAVSWPTGVADPKRDM